MEDGGITRQPLDEVLARYLQSWGLREFHDEASYYDWQRTTVSSPDLQALQSLVAQRQGGENEEADIQFYNLLAKPSLLAVLYSQRFDYFLKIGALLSPRISSAEHVLDFGCGVGILTCFFAQQYPAIQFVGIDRSARSIEIAQREANKRLLPNVQFRVTRDSGVSGACLYDCILSTQALLQSEREPGLPSVHWHTFEREKNPARQEELEDRTGLKRRLDALLQVLSPAGRLICFEKTWNLGRRIFFQRAMSGRGLAPVCDPVPCSYHELGEWRIDGPLYEVTPDEVHGCRAWNEAPYQSEGETLYRCAGAMAERMEKELSNSQSQEAVRGQHATYGPWAFRFGVWGEALSWVWCETGSGLRGLVIASKAEEPIIGQLFKKAGNLRASEFEEFMHNNWGHFHDVVQNDFTPGYENHSSSAQGIYEALPQKNIQQKTTLSDGQGKEMHIEIGATKTLCYLYWANTYDQRQIVLTDEAGAEMLTEYYLESLKAAHDSA
ncbi:MAG: methyltransferase domain-containing protein [Nitrospirales bacterium]